MNAGIKNRERVDRFSSPRHGKYAVPEYLKGAEIGLPGSVICRFAGSLNYGNAEHFMNQILSFVRESKPSIRRLVLQCDSIRLDYVAAQRLMELADRIKATKASFVLTNVPPEIDQFLRDCGAFEVFKPSEVFTSTEVEPTVKHLRIAAKHTKSGPRS